VKPSCVRRLMHLVTTTFDDTADNAVDSRVNTRPRRGRQAGPGGAASTKRFPQFPPGATAAAAKAARAGDVSDNDRSVSLPVLSSRGSTTTTSVNNLSVTPCYEMSGQQSSSPRDCGEQLEHHIKLNFFLNFPYFSIGWRGGATGRALDLRSTGDGFKSY